MIGKIISHYRIVSRLGEGGMGVVYKAEDTRLDRFVALKFLRSEDLAHDRKILDRFRREAKAASALNHPNICTIYDIGGGDSETFIAMELMEGQSLKDVIASGPLPIDRTLEWALQITDALEASHSKGIVHRDLKPGNIFITSRGQAKLLDFGLAKMVEPKARDTDGPKPTYVSEMTKPGSVFGTIGYMSPEQVRGEEVDARSDLFSLGVVLYEMATSKPPFTGDTPGLLFDSILNRVPIAPIQCNPDLPPKLSEIIIKALEKDRTLRCQSASEVAAGLLRVRDSLRKRVEAEQRAREEAEEEQRRKLAASLFRQQEEAKIDSPDEAEEDAALLPIIPDPAHSEAGRVRPTHDVEPAIARNGGPSNQDAAGKIEKKKQLTSGNRIVAAIRKPYIAITLAGVLVAASYLGRIIFTASDTPIAKPPDGSQALEGHRKACDAGNPQGCVDLANMYAKGEGVQTDKALAAELYKKACDANNAEGCNSLGRMYGNGEGVQTDRARAAELYKKACDASFARGCTNLGIIYDNGKGVQTDRARAAELYKKACDAGEARGCTNLAEMYDYGEVVTADKALAAELYKKACDSGGANGCASLAEMYDNGRGVKTDKVLAAELFKKACDANNGYGCNGLGTMYGNGEGVQTDNARAAELFKKACDAGSAEGCGNLGVKYFTGEGVQTDNARAAELFKKACDASIAQGCNNLGMMYFKGEGVQTDKARAAELYKKACDAASALACTHLGMMYDRGKSVQTDKARAAELYKKACDSGSADGCADLAEMYSYGEGVQMDKARAAKLYKSAVELYKKACDAGSAAGCTNLGEMYSHGDGVQMDKARAAKLFKKACDAGNAEGCKSLKAAN